MRLRRLPLAIALAVLAGGGIASVALQRSAEPEADFVFEEGYECTTCDARAAAKKRSREALQAKAAKDAEDE